MAFQLNRIIKKIQNYFKGFWFISFSLNGPLANSVRGLCVPSVSDRNRESWRLLVKEHILLVNQNNMHSGGGIAGGGSVAVAFGVGDRLQVTGDRQQVTGGT